MVTSPTDPRCNDTDIRLIGVSRPNEGRVEYCNEGVWGTVCGDRWDRKNALVVCRQLGLPTEGRTTSNKQRYHSENNTYHMLQRHQ